jgi:hypothetical protein
VSLRKAYFEKLPAFTHKNKTVLYLAASFVKNKSISSIIDETMIDEKTVYKYFSYFRRCRMNLNFLNETRLGGDGIEMEIDETNPFTRKYHRVNILASGHIWIFGTIERVSKKYI